VPPGARAGQLGLCAATAEQNATAKTKQPWAKLGPPLSPEPENVPATSPSSARRPHNTLPCCLLRQPHAGRSHTSRVRASARDLRPRRNIRPSERWRADIFSRWQHALLHALHSAVDGNRRVAQAQRSLVAPVVAPFSGEWPDSSPAMSPDGSYVVFQSTRPKVPLSSGFPSIMTGSVNEMVVFSFAPPRHTFP